MKIELNNLPNQPDVLHQIILSLNSEIESLLSENISLKELLKLLKAKRYGKSSEKLDNQIEQLELWLEENDTDVDLEDNIDTDDDIAVGHDLKSGNNKKKVKTGRCKLPENLPRENKLLSPAPKCPSCGGEDFRKIGETSVRHWNMYHLHSR